MKTFSVPNIAITATSGLATSSKQSEDKFDADAWIYVLPGTDAARTIGQAFTGLPTDVSAQFITSAKRRAFEAKAGESLSIDSPDGARHTCVFVNQSAGMFQLLTQARKVVMPSVIEVKARHVVFDLRAWGTNVEEVADAFVSAAVAGTYKFPKYKGPRDKKPKGAAESDKPELRHITIITEKSKVKRVQEAADTAYSVTGRGTNLARWLSKRAGNDLTCKTYIGYLKQVAADQKWKFEHIDHAQLVAMKAGAFLAVVKGSEHMDYGIVKLSYTPARASKSLALVGKGLVFDTGGYNIKTTHMLGMHGDMGGSAVALSLLNVAATQKWPVKITAYLAIADNMIGPRSYKPNDVITAMNGTTIEVIDTDAEGRMVLSDTLTLASQSKPDLLMDFATLTGACVRAIGTTFSGVFTNRSEFHSQLIEAGYESGERVWPFPMDKDFGECLESTSADTKQCRERGGVDHIEASQFLQRFIDKDIPWVHVDLSAIENQGGLAHVATDETGFGVRFARRFTQKILGY